MAAGQVTVVPPRHEPAEQVRPVVHLLVVSQLVPSALGVTLQVPSHMQTLVLHESLLQGELHGVQVSMSGSMTGLMQSGLPTGQAACWIWAYVPSGTGDISLRGLSQPTPEVSAKTTAKKPVVAQRRTAPCIAANATIPGREHQ